MDEYIDIQTLAQIKGLKNTRSLRIEINKGAKSKYIAREVKIQGGKSYEILIATLEPEVQEAIQNLKIKENQLVPIKNDSNQLTFVSENARLRGLAKIDLINHLLDFRKKYKIQKEADRTFLDLYNSGEYLKQIFKVLGTTSRGTLCRWLAAYKNGEDLCSKYKYTKIDEYNSSLTPEMINVFLKFLLHPNKFKVGKAISLTIHVLEKEGMEYIPAPVTFRRYANNFRKIHYDKWVLMREGEKAFDDKVMPYIERDLSQLEVGDVLVADGHRLNFQVINPFTGKPTRATLVGFLDWKSGALVGYEIMMEENTQCIASALRNAILNLGLIPKVVYQDNGRAFKAKYFQHCNFDEEGFSGVYQNLGIKSVFAKPMNAKAKVIERFFLEFQEEFEKMMPSYTGTSIQDKPPRLLRGEKFHKKIHEQTTKNKVPTVQEAIKLIDYWLEYHNSKPCINIPKMTVKQVLNSVEKQKINVHSLDYLMMKTEVKTIHRNGVRFLGFNYYSDALFGLRDRVLIRYSLFDLTKINVYSTKGEFLCVAKRVTGTHPMAHHLGSITDMEGLKQKVQKKQRLKNKVIKDVKKLLPEFDVELLKIEAEEAPVIDVTPELPSNVVKFERQKKRTPRQIQMNKPIFNSDFEKCEWLKQHGCTNQEDRAWLENYLKSDEYINLYGDIE